MNTSPAVNPAHKDMANALRALAMDAVEKAKSGHPGMPMGMADTATVLWSEILKHHPKQPAWPDRDRFVLSAGHGSMLLYGLLHLTGYEDVTLEEIKNFRQFGSKTAGHPEYGHTVGVETTTGPLGQGLGNAVGMALAEKMLAARFGKDIVDHYTYVIAGDGCLMEGISHEAASFAGHMKLGKLIVLFDDNGISIDGPTSLSVSDDHLKRFESYGWDVQAVDGHDPAAVLGAIKQAQQTDTPSLIACKTTIGFGAPKKAGTAGSHGSPLGAEEIEGARKALGWSHGAFEVPDSVRQAWFDSTREGAKAYQEWEKRFGALPAEKKALFEQMQSGALPKDWKKAVAEMKQALAASAPNEATRKSSGNALNTLTKAVPNLIGGSADLSESNNTHAKEQKPVTAADASGSYIYYGVREHAMGSIMNGLALHGGFIPYGGTFLVFSDYMRPAIRLSALMGTRVVYVMTHDSIGLGEDGPTHQPVEHVAALRAIPNLLVFRPADATETLECWEYALQHQGPSLLALSRQNLPSLVKEYVAENRVAKGAYIVRDAKDAKAVILATGSEVSIAVEAAEKLAAKNIAVRVVSVPCLELFAKQPAAEKEKLLGKNTLRVVAEAGVIQGWERYLGENGIFIGMSSFGASAPAPELFKQFGITAERMVAEIEKSL
ncbi:MAG: transketolase [Rickettsiales bacterium]